jgi:hypothetical protein
MAVGATDSTGGSASFSNVGSWVHLAAPGVTVMSTWHEITDLDTTHMYVAVLDGTSMSSPHATGVAALLESYNPSLTGTDKFNLMVNNTAPFAPANTKVLGSGILNAQLALAAAPPVVGVPPNVTRPARTLSLRASPNPGRAGSDLLLRALPGGRVSVAVVDASGRQVRALEGVASADGGLRLRWDGRDSAGRRAGTGVYMILAKSGREHAAAKLVVLE